MDAYQDAGEMVRAFRKQLSLSQKQLAIEMQLVDDREGENMGSISVSTLSQIEHGARLLSPKYLKLIIATGIFSQQQIDRLWAQAALDLIRRQFGIELPSLLASAVLEI